MPRVGIIAWNNVYTIDTFRTIGSFTELRCRLLQYRLLSGQGCIQSHLHPKLHPWVLRNLPSGSFSFGMLLKHGHWTHLYERLQVLFKAKTLSTLLNHSLAFCSTWEFTGKVAPQVEGSVRFLPGDQRKSPWRSIVPWPQQEMVFVNMLVLETTHEKQTKDNKMVVVDSHIYNIS